MVLGNVFKSAAMFARENKLLSFVVVYGVVYFGLYPIRVLVPTANQRAESRIGLDKRQEAIEDIRQDKDQKA